MRSRRGTEADTIDVERFRLPPNLMASTNGKASTKPPRHRQGERFLKGPIPWPWILRATRLPRGALSMALVLWRLSGVRRSRTVQLTAAGWREVFPYRQNAYRALARLEAAGLVSVERQQGRGPAVTLLDAT